MAMSAKRFETLASGQSAMAQKVLHAIPKKEEWPIQKIAAELTRVGTPMEHRLIMGCARTLVEAGLVREPIPGTFIQAATREPTQMVSTVTPMMGAKHHLITPPEEKESSMDKLARLAEELKQVSKTAQRIASEIEDAATQAEEEVQAMREKLAGFEQLGALLQKLTPKS